MTQEGYCIATVRDGATLYVTHQRINGHDNFSVTETLCEARFWTEEFKAREWAEFAAKAMPWHTKNGFGFRVCRVELRVVGVN